MATRLTVQTRSGRIVTADPDSWICAILSALPDHIRDAALSRVEQMEANAVVLTKKAGVFVVAE